MIDSASCITVTIGRPTPKTEDLSVYPLYICALSMWAARGRSGWVKGRCALSKGTLRQMQAQSSPLGEKGSHRRGASSWDFSLEGYLSHKSPAAQEMVASSSWLNPDHAILEIPVSRLPTPHSESPSPPRWALLSLRYVSSAKTPKRVPGAEGTGVIVQHPPQTQSTTQVAQHPRPA